MRASVFQSIAGWGSGSTRLCGISQRTRSCLPVLEVRTLPDVDINVTQGSGTGIRAFQKVSGNYDQYVREARGTARGTLGNIPWTVTTAGLSAVVAADVTRVGLVLVSAANGIVWIRFDATIPTGTTYDWLLNPLDRWEVPLAFTQLALSMAGSAAGGLVLGAAGTCA
jgi:hypothetical protein